MPAAAATSSAALTVSVEEILALRCEAGIVGETTVRDLCELALYAPTAAARAIATEAVAKRIAEVRAM